MTVKAELRSGQRVKGEKGRMEIVIQLLTNHLIPYLFSMGLYIFAIRWEGLTLRGLVLFFVLIGVELIVLFYLFLVC